MKHNLKKFLGAVGIVALVLFSLAPVFSLYLRMLQGAYQVTSELGQPELVLAAGFMISAMLVLFFGLTMVLSVFFYYRDLSILVPLPLQPGTIMGSKFAVIIVYEYLTIAPFLIPAMLVFGSGSGVGLLYWIIALLVFLLTPVIPLGVAALFTLMLMSLTNLSRKRDTLRIVGMVFFLLLVFLLNYLLSGIPEGGEMAYIEEILQKREGLLLHMTRIFPPALVAVRALSAAGHDFYALALGAGDPDRAFAPGNAQFGGAVVAAYHHGAEQRLKPGFVQTHHNFVPNYERRDPAQPPAGKFLPRLRVFTYIFLHVIDALFPKVHLRRMTVGSALRSIHDHFGHLVWASFKTAFGQVRQLF